MKIYNIRPGAIILLLVSAVLLNSCKKGDVRKEIKADFKTFYRVSPTAPTTVTANGTNYIGFAHFPGGGEGNATHLGACKNYFNQLAYTDQPEGQILGSVNAPVADVINYPITGAPLPLIQSGDFNALVAANNRYHFPVDVQGKIINSVIFDEQGNAVFTSSISNETFPISETVVGFKGKGIILGGRGRFNGSHGEFNFNGYFNVVNPNDAEYHLEGWIGY